MTQRLRLAILGTQTLDLVRSQVEKQLGVFGLTVESYAAPFAGVATEILDSTSGLHRYDPDVIALVIDAQDHLGPEIRRPAAFEPEEHARALERGINEAASIWDLTSRTFARALVLCTDLVPPPDTLGLLEGHGYTLRRATELSSARLRELAARAPNVRIVPWLEVVLEDGWRALYDERLWYHARTRLSARGTRRLAELIARHVLVSRGLHPKKCVVVDLDGTLWGGVVGEVGADGITLGPDGPGAAYVDFQQALAALADRGVLLAIASKNNEADALEVIERHPHMVLRRENFAAVRISWGDKTAAIREIARDLRIGLESIVFFDDSPVERDAIRATLAGVTVIDLDGRPEGYARLLRALPLFDQVTVSAEDRSRTVLYRAESSRARAQESATDLSSYLASLCTVVRIAKNRRGAIDRVVQLLARTNQFNLTTRRHDRAHIERLLSTGMATVYDVEVTDRFGDSGIVGAVIVEHKHTASIESFALSCRVIGRGVESAILAEVAADARRTHGRAELEAEFVSTKKNAPARDFLEKHGFYEWEPGCFRLPTDTQPMAPPHVTVVSLPEEGALA